MPRRDLVRFGAVALLALGSAACASLDPQPTVRALVVDLGRRSELELKWPTPEPAEAGAPAAEVQALLDDGLSADDAAQIAWQNCPALRAELEELGIAHAEFVRAGRLANPSLELSRLEASPGGGSRREVGFGFELLDALLLPLRKKLGAMELEGVRLRLGQRLLDEAADARRDFFDLAAAERRVERTTALRDLDAAAAELAERQHQAGNIAVLELEARRAPWHRSRLALAEDRLAARVAREALQRRLGLWGADAGSWKLQDADREPPAEEVALEDLESVALAHRLDIGAARAAVDLVDRALALRRGTRWVPLQLEVGVRRERDLDGLRLTGPTLRLELPIFDSGAIDIAVLEAEQRKSRYQLDALAIDVRSQVREARDRLIAARDLYFFYQQTVLPQQQILFDQQLRHVNMMVHGVYDLVETRKEALMMEHEAITSWRDYWQARVALERALGIELDRLTQEKASPGGSP